ncbi:peptidase inhibitor family I36 protein [Kribbella sp. NPDC020789]
MFVSRVLAVAAAIAATLPLTTQAVAAGPDITPAQFASEVRGLSSTQRQELQHAVNAELAKHGGRQIAANKVLWANGEAATTIQSQADAGDPSSCAYGYFCVYTGSGYTGNRTDFYNCRSYTYYDDFWSYVNNQTGGTVATLYLDQPGGPDYTPGAWHGQYTWNGLNYSAIKPC